MSLKSFIGNLEPTQEDIARDKRTAIVDGVYMRNHPIRKEMLKRVWARYNMLPDVITDSLGKLYDIVSDLYMPEKNWKSLHDYTHDGSSMYSINIKNKYLHAGAQNETAEIRSIVKDNYIRFPYKDENGYTSFIESIAKGKDGNYLIDFNGGETLNSFNKNGKLVHGVYDDSGKITDSSDNEGFEIISDEVLPSRSRLLNTTAQLFREKKIGTLVSRFYGGNTDIEYIDSAKSSQYGNSRGRNLLKKNSTTENGYDNPYCRAWTWHKQYSKVSDLIRPLDGFNFEEFEEKNYVKAFRTEKGGRRLRRNGVLNNQNGFVNIAPSYSSSREIKKCMFSIENLAWKDVYKKMGNENLTEEQKGPNGGRIMWFPPYDLSFQENVNVDWNETTFIGRGEPVYTYTNTRRSGTLTFTMIIDHPSLLNGRYASAAKSNEIDEYETELLRFFAGCDLPTDIEYPNKIVKPEGYTKTVTAETVTFNEDKCVKDSFFICFPHNYSGNMNSGGDSDWARYLVEGCGSDFYSGLTNGYEYTDKSISDGIDDFKPEWYVEDDTIKEIGELFNVSSRLKRDEIINGVIEYLNNRSSLEDYTFSDDLTLVMEALGLTLYDSDSYELSQCAMDIMEALEYARDTYPESFGDKLKEVCLLLSIEYKDEDYSMAEVEEYLNGIIYGSYYIDMNIISAYKMLYEQPIDPYKQQETVNAIIDKLEKNTNEKLNEEMSWVNDVKVTVDCPNNTKTTYYYRVDNDLKSCSKYSKYNSSNKLNTKAFSVAFENISSTTSFSAIYPIIEGKSGGNENIKSAFENKTIGRIEISAFSSGDDENSSAIAKKRAETVKKWLSKTDAKIEISHKTIPEKTQDINNENSKKYDSVYVELFYNTPSTEGGYDTNNRKVENKTALIVTSTTIENQYGYSYIDEGKYFNDLAKEDSFTYNKIAEKIKYFNPAFHSITPEGFNSRLNFLHQCTRQGNTLELNDDRNGTNKTVASNLSFGRPPFCVLRIGDFINTKMLIKGFSISYENGGGMQWDLNPEGIGVQPMFAKITLNIDIIGGQSLEAPIAKLNNAISFNYYANSSVYDHRADIASYDGNGGITYDKIWTPKNGDYDLIIDNRHDEPVIKENDIASIKNKGLNTVTPPKFDNLLMK